VIENWLVAVVRYSDIQIKGNSNLKTCNYNYNYYYNYNDDNAIQCYNHKFTK